MGDLEKRDRAEEEEEENERFLEGMAVVDFDMLCSTVALQAQRGKWRSFENVGEEEEEEGGEFGGVLRMWEGEVQDCFDDRRIAIESACCPCYRFGKNMRRAGFGSCFIQGRDSSLDDCIYHLICPCCTLCQESRTLEMNNVQDGTWHGRGDTICIGGFGEGSKAFFELQQPPLVSINSPEPCSMPKSTDGSDRVST
ncbi:uncharacterized protein LOC133869552 isoform X2 [Alnus glutinosa]|uniref:uncharacterized protein LOC133869552 isoform X2 n=1 Tax=Alnus glutinosa TaxID=3517 RepID=UPI002D77188B|nr:uncharacterized protein LOC133869552 isoform X2 [Alnus glutinosa]